MQTKTWLCLATGALPGPSAVPIPLVQVLGLAGDTGAPPVVSEPSDCHSWLWPSRWHLG